MPYTHLLLILKSGFKPVTLEYYDRIVLVELPNLDKQCYLYSLVMKHMMHGLYSSMNKDNICMRDGVCENHCPKEFCEFIIHAENGYPYYRRRDNSLSVRVR